MLEKHVLRFKMKAEHPCFLKQTPETMVNVWKELNKEFQLSIPDKHFDGIPEITERETQIEMDNSILQLCYSFGETKTTFENSIAILNLLTSRMSIKRPLSFTKENPSDFLFREEIDTEKSAGFFWVAISNAPPSSTNAVQLIEWVRSQKNYRMPTFELIQALLLYPEIILYINSIMGPSLGILGLQTTGLHVPPLSSVSIGRTIPCFAILSANPCKIHSEVQELRMHHVPESANLKNAGILCHLTRHLHINEH